MQRIITLKGSVVTKDANGFIQGINDASEQTKAYNHLLNSGWGVFSLSLSRSILGSVVNFGYVNYDIQIQINAPLNENPERVRQGVSGSLGAVLTA